VRIVRKGATSISYQVQECVTNTRGKRTNAKGEAVASYMGVIHSVGLVTLQISQLGLHD